MHGNMTRWNFSAEEARWLEKQANDHNLGCIGKTLRDLIVYYGSVEVSKLQKYAPADDTLEEGGVEVPFRMCHEDLKWLAGYGEQLGVAATHLLLRALVLMAMKEGDVEELFESTRVIKNTNHLYFDVKSTGCIVW